MEQGTRRRAEEGTEEEEEFEPGKETLISPSGRTVPQTSSERPGRGSRSSSASLLLLLGSSGSLLLLAGSMLLYALGGLGSLWIGFGFGRQAPVADADAIDERRDTSSEALIASLDTLLVPRSIIVVA